MKKYVIVCLAVVAILLASCKNEDISISREVFFEVKPYGTIQEFVKHQVYEDDLETFSTGDKLRVNLFVYDSKGVLTASETKYVDDYRSTMNSTFDLADGVYTVVATSDVTTMSGGDVSFEYWEFSGTNNLSELKIKDAGYMGWDDKILGVSYEQITVASGKTNYSIDLEPAGALVVIQHNGIHTFNDVVSYELEVNKSSDYCSFGNGGFQPVINESATYNWRLSNLVVGNYSGNNIYSYKFVLPLGKTDFVWVAYLEEGYLLLDETHNILDIKQGKMYNCVFNIPELSCEFYEFGNAKALNFASDLIRDGNANKGMESLINIK
ncbi:MAG: hypothetical protein IJ622_09135 [Bacteroidales bacterium]|nr:hypothetical protein [Bacteroidales bacterium]